MKMQGKMSKLRSLRKKRGLTLLDVSGAVGIDVSHLSRIENGKQVPSPDVAKRLAVFFKGKVSEMDILYPKQAR